MFKQRVITGLVLLAIIFLVLFCLPPIALVITLVLVFGVAAWEWANLASIKNSFLQLTYAAGILVCVLGLAYLVKVEATQVLLMECILGLGCAWWIVALLWVIYYPGSAVYWHYSLVKAALGFFVLVPSALALIFLGNLPSGNWIFLYVVGIVVMADVGAYFVGRSLGKSKLAPNVSPGKSWAGFWGGFISAMVYAALVGLQYHVAGLSMVSLIIVTGLAALASVLGDLLESMLKRERGIKDSSQLLPGHGGFMDRIDSITAAAPVFTLSLLLIQASQ